MPTGETGPMGDPGPAAGVVANVGLRHSVDDYAYYRAAGGASAKAYTISVDTPIIDDDRDGPMRP